MSYKYDIELFLYDLEKIFKDNFNNKVNQINNEKINDSPIQKDDFAIENINDAAWYFYNIPSNWSYSKFIVYGLSDIQLSAQQYDGHIQTVTVFFEVAIMDEGLEPSKSQIYKLLRYTRCLQEIALENFDKIRHYGKIQVDSLPPTVVDVSGKILKTSGINVTASFDV